MRDYIGFGIPVVAISGPAGSGKTEASKVLLGHAWRRIPLASPIKHMLRAGLGLTVEHTDGSLKEEPIPRFGGLTPRRLMQTLGTEWGRALDEEFWLRQWLQEARYALFDGVKGIVVDDLRFLNEATFLRREASARLISIVTPHAGTLGEQEASHASELELGAIVSQADAVVLNRKANLRDFQHAIRDAAGLD